MTTSSVSFFSVSSAASAAVVSSAALVAAAAVVSVFSVSAALMPPLLPLRAGLHVSFSCSPPCSINIELFCLSAYPYL